MGEPPWLYLNQRGSLSSAFLHQALLHDLFIQTIREVLEARIEMPSAGTSTDTSSFCRVAVAARHEVAPPSIFNTPRQNTMYSRSCFVWLGKSLTGPSALRTSPPTPHNFRFGQ